MKKQRIQSVWMESWTKQNQQVTLLNHDQSDSKMENTSGHATVKLVSSQRIPAKTVVILEGQIDCDSKFNTPMLFEPNHAIFNQTDLQVETALILPDDSNKVKVTGCNNFNKSSDWKLN